MDPKSHAKCLGCGRLRLVPDVFSSDYFPSDPKAHYRYLCQDCVDAYFSKHPLSKEPLLKRSPVEGDIYCPVCHSLSQDRSGQILTHGVIHLGGIRCPISKCPGCVDKPYPEPKLSESDWGPYGIGKQGPECKLCGARLPNEGFAKIVGERSKYGNKWPLGICIVCDYYTKQNPQLQ
jgi:hypothetical protein